MAAVPQRVQKAPVDRPHKGAAKEQQPLDAEPPAATQFPQPQLKLKNIEALANQLIPGERLLSDFRTAG